MIRSTPSSKACCNSSKLRTSNSIFKFLPFALQYSLARVTALWIPPEKSTWLSFKRIISNKPIRWLHPPPIFTAIFSRIRIPGVVLRVSSTRVLVPSSFFTYLLVMVAIPLMRCMIFSIKRSVCNNDWILPSTIMATSPGFTQVPSSMNTSTFMVGSKRWNTILAISIPAKIPSSLISNFDLPIASAGILDKVVWSPSPISSANDKSISLSIKSFTIFSSIVCSFYMIR